MFKATGTLKKLGTRDSHIFFFHKWHGIPIPELKKCYERKHYYVLKVFNGLTVRTISLFLPSFLSTKKTYNSHLLTFTEVFKWEFDTQGDNYAGLQPDRFIGKRVHVEASNEADHKHYGLKPEYYPNFMIEEA